MAVENDSINLSRRGAFVAGMGAALHAPTPAALIAMGTDRFTARNQAILQLEADINSVESDEAAEPLFDLWGALDDEILALKPKTLEEAIGALVYARREHARFGMGGDEVTGDKGEMVVLHLIDGALGFLRGIAAQRPPASLSATLSWTA